MNTPVHVLSLADERRVKTRTSVTDIFRSNAGYCFDLKTLTEPLRFHPTLPMPGLVFTVFRLTHYALAWEGSGENWAQLVIN